MITPFDSPETTVLGVVFVLYGYLLRVHGVSRLVAGFDGETGISKTRATKTIGTFSLLVGVSTISFGYVMSFIDPTLGNFGLVYAAIVLLAVLGCTYRINTTTEHSAEPQSEAHSGSRSPEPSD